jgi:hypothetical protein
MSFHKTVWQTLSAIDCSKNIEKKGNLSYLSWAWAWAALMEHFPASSYAVLEPTVHSDGTYTVNISVTVSDGAKAADRTMWLPVMDNRNNAIANPSARQISDTTMRCLVKCIAMFGLGLYIYAGEDIPTAAAQPVKVEQIEQISALIDKTGTDKDKVFKAYKVTRIEDLTQDNAKHLISVLEKRV